MKFKIKLKKALANNYDLVFGLFFFIAYRLFFTWLLWHGRNVPPEPDDSYFYLANAKHFLEINTFERFRLLPFSLWLNFLSFFTNFNLENAYKLNFYVGPFIMFAAVYYFVVKLEKNRIIRLLLLLVIALYSGSGDYHGFYWVVESFYQTALFLVILGVLIDEKKTKLHWLFIISFLFIFIHPTSVFLSVVFFVYPAALAIFSRKGAAAVIYKLIPVSICLAIAATIYITLGRSLPSTNSNESFQIQIALLKNFFYGRLNTISFPVIWREYFAIFFNNVFTTITYFAMFALLLFKKQYKLLAIFFSILPVVLLSSFVPYGSRTLGLLWPITFFVIGYFLVGLWQIFQRFNSKYKLGYLTAIPLTTLFSVATIFNTIYISSMNATKNYIWDRSCPSRITSENVYFASQESLNAFVLYRKSEKNLQFLSQDVLGNFSKAGNLLIETNSENLQPPHLSGIQDFLAARITRRSKSVKVQYPHDAWTNPPVDLGTSATYLSVNNLGIKKYMDCGHFQISKVESL